jgi:hypothetical protein
MPIVGWVDSEEFDRHASPSRHPEFPARLRAIRTACLRPLEPAGCGTGTSSRPGPAGAGARPRVRTPGGEPFGSGERSRSRGWYPRGARHLPGSVVGSGRRGPGSLASHVRSVGPRVLLGTAPGAPRAARSWDGFLRLQQRGGWRNYGSAPARGPPGRHRRLGRASRERHRGGLRTSARRPVRELASVPFLSAHRRCHPRTRRPLSTESWLRFCCRLPPETSSTLRRPTWYRRSTVTIG